MLARNRSAIASLRLAFGILTLAAIGVQFVSASHEPSFHPANFFGFFTILSNTLAALVFLFVATRTPNVSHAVDVLRGAATLAMALVGIIFSLLLANLDSNVVPWVNVVVHYVMPTVVVIDWVVDPPTTRLDARDAALWLAFPLAYVTYTLARGAIVHWYPYPFLDVDARGYPIVGAYVASIFVFTLVLAAVVRLVARWRSGKGSE